jgi:DNA-binding transcriptional MerR regulator
MRTSELARRAGVNVQTLRFYEREGLLKPPSRTASGYRAYSPDDLERLRVIRVCQQIGFTLNQVRDVLEPHGVLSSECTGAGQKSAARDTVLASARKRLAELDEKLVSLTRMRADMAFLVETLAAGALSVCPASRAKGAAG